jgi:hypothetical protein
MHACTANAAPPVRLQGVVAPLTWLACGLDPGALEPWVQVDVSEEEEGFAGVATAALNTLLLGLETRLDACLGSLMRCNWAATESVSAGLARRATLAPRRASRHARQTGLHCGGQRAGKAHRRAVPNSVCVPPSAGGRPVGLRHGHGAHTAGVRAAAGRRAAGASLRLPVRQGAHIRAPACDTSSCTNQALGSPRGSRTQDAITMTTQATASPRHLRATSLQHRRITPAMASCATGLCSHMHA